MRWFIFIFINVVVVTSKNLEPRTFLDGTYTTTVIQSKFVTNWAPSSCIQIDATLPPCRSVRYLQFPNLANYPFLDSINNNNNDNLRTETILKTTPLGWGEYFGLYAPTVTETNVEIYTTKIYDPNIIVTFAVKGCRPQRLPIDIHSCPPSEPQISIEEVLPTTTIPTLIKPSTTATLITTKVQSTSAIHQPLNLPSENFIEPSGEGDDNEQEHFHINNQQTEILH